MKARLRRLPDLGLEAVMEHIPAPMTEAVQRPEAGGGLERSRWRGGPSEGVAGRGCTRGREVRWRAVPVRGREGRWRAVPGEVMESQLLPLSQPLQEAGGNKHTEGCAGLKQRQVKINIAVAK